MLTVLLLAGCGTLSVMSLLCLMWSLGDVLLVICQDTLCECIQEYISDGENQTLLTSGDGGDGRDGAQVQLC